MALAVSNDCRDPDQHPDDCPHCTKCRGYSDGTGTCDGCRRDPRFANLPGRWRHTRNEWRFGAQDTWVCKPANVLACRAYYDCEMYKTKDCTFTACLIL